MALPPLTAGPNEVRVYITRILVCKHDAAPELAQQIARQWTLGRPGDLRRAGMKYFDQVFGSEVGTFLFRTVQEDIRAEWDQSLLGIVIFWTPILSIGLTVFFVVRAYRQTSATGMIASIRYATLTFGPPMVFCGFQDGYNSFQAMKIVSGMIVSFFAFLWYAVRFCELLEARSKEKKKAA
ncbi:hypothetical protein ATEIFO6365_0008044100 [Aspergillus terreus]|uniref:Uncharacterized protein n=1 Tax=Aspergillus terreus TaxID=33178 RepID=A0A5M3ZB22_ASPTE|nr:hypothetical protein ATETN484_0010045000 [Aspergillus terreus]GFF18497.1 hypothetical protein ATEIFO6365_0008044100 [Aspergillus terreus]